jgi:hypothetical protein
MCIAKGVNLKLLEALKYVDPTETQIQGSGRKEEKPGKTLFSTIIQPLITGVEKNAK